MGRLLTIQQTAEKLAPVTVDTLRYWRQTGKGPRCGKLGRRLVYREEDLDAWVAEQFGDGSVGAR